MRKLVVFDIDGTLTIGDRLGTQCFFRAFRVEYGLDAITESLDGYRHSTDSGIAHQALSDLWGRAPLAEELLRLQRTYLQLLDEALQAEPRAYRPIGGAAAMLAAVGNRPDLTHALATGNWQAAAQRKLDSAELEVGDLTGAYADDARSREDVLACAIRRGDEASELSGQPVVYVGDRVWDLLAARAVGAAFVGIAAGESAQDLRNAGAETVLPDYQDVEAFLGAVEAAAA